MSDASAGPFLWRTRVRLQEVDAAGVVFFARYFEWCHDAMAAMLDGNDAGYAKMLVDRGRGFPTVHAEADYAAPVRFGDGIVVAVTVASLGTSSCTLDFRVERADGVVAARIRHVVAWTDVGAMRAEPIPDEVRALLDRHRVGPARTE